MRVLLIFCIILLMLMCGAVGRLFAEAPTTPKILFTSARDGNREIYIMNPNGSEQVRLTELHGMKAQCFSFGMKFRPLGKDQTPKIDLTFSPKCSIILTTIWTTL